MLRRTTDPSGPIGTKRALLLVSRVLEDVIAEEAGRRGGPVATIALLQDATYFDHEAERYTRLATYGPVVVGFAGTPARPAPGVEVLELSADEPLADEWTVIVLADQGSAPWSPTTSTPPSRHGRSSRAACPPPR